jgi:superfamily II DNA/RNA helicase
MTTTFARLGLPDAIVRTLADRAITEPFPIQAAAIPDALAGRDISGKAPTGSGKTLAFGLPLMARVDKAAPKRPRGLVLAPTRELAEQIKQELAPVARATGRRVAAIYGGVSYGPQLSALRSGVDVLVATPGRLEDLMQSRSIQLDDVAIVVIDEGDRMADMGFMPAVRRILDATGSNRQTMLFSATLDGDVAALSRTYQRSPVLHESGSEDDSTVDAHHHFWRVEPSDRLQQTAEIIDRYGRSIVFTRTRHGADRLVKQLRRHGVEAAALHGGRSQSQRTRALARFASGDVQSLIATDVAARGIHVDAVDCVVHFDPPVDDKTYVHRSGRTARAGADGTVVSLIGRDQQRAARRLIRDLGLDADIEGPEVAALRPVTSPSRPTSRPRKAPAENTNGADTSSNIYVANLPWKATEADVTKLFSGHGRVHETTIVMDRKTGRSRGFAFVSMAAPDVASAIDRLNGHRLGGRELMVRRAHPKAKAGTGRRQSFPGQKRTRR